MLAALLTAGCAAADMGVSDSTYVSAMAELQRLVRNSPDSVRQEQRDSIMEAHGVTAEQLERAAEWLSEHPDDAAQMWRQIDRQSRMVRD